MYRNMLALAAIVAMQAITLQAHAVTLCTAGNPNTTSVAESTPTSAFVDHNDGTVTHSLTGLMWKRCAQGLSGADCATGTATKMTWSAALAVAVADAAAGYRDWRLPNKKELESIVESCGFNPAINQTVFPATPTSYSSYFWSGSTYPLFPSDAWGVDQPNGGTFTLSKTSVFYVRLVRGGQSLGYFDATALFDIDGNGTVDALIDGQLIIRYLFGLRDTALIQGAVGAGAQRTSATEIEAYIRSILP